MVWLRFAAIFIIVLFISGCSMHHKNYINHVGPAQKYSYQSSHRVSKTKNGVYIYKDNSSYNAVGYDPFYALERTMPSSSNSSDGIIHF